MQQIKGWIDRLREGIEEGLSNLEDAQNTLVHVKMNELKDDEGLANVISKVQEVNEKYAAQVYDGLKVINSVIAKKSKDVVDYLDQ